MFVHGPFQLVYIDVFSPPSNFFLSSLPCGKCFGTRQPSTDLGMGDIEEEKEEEKEEGSRGGRLGKGEKGVDGIWEQLTEQL